MFTVPSSSMLISQPDSSTSFLMFLPPGPISMPIFSGLILIVSSRGAYLLSSLRLETIKINPEKIGMLIGPGGKNIKKLVEESGCEINIEDDGTVNIYSVAEEGMKIARDAIMGMTAEAEIGKIYRGRVVTVKEFGAFVEFLPGKDGLVHISELANFRVKQTEDIVKLGDEIWVKCIGVDEKGRVRLSRRAAMEERDKEMAGKDHDKEAPARERDPARE